MRERRHLSRGGVDPHVDPVCPCTYTAGVWRVSGDLLVHKRITGVLVDVCVELYRT